MGKSVNALVRYFIAGLLLISVVLISACSGLFDNAFKQNNNNLNILSAQVVFDEAAKGPANADLDKLKAQVYELLTNPAQAEILAELKDSTNDYFIHKLLLLPSLEQTHEIFKHWLSKVSQTNKIIDKMGASQKPLAILASSSRAVAGDQLDYRQELIKDLVHYGDSATLAESDEDEIKLILAALLIKGDKILMKKAFNSVNNTVKDTVLDWVASEQTKTIADSQDQLLDVFKDSLLKSDISKQMVVDAAQAGHVNKLKFFYDMVVKNRASTVPVLANMRAKNGVADRFSHFLAKLVPDTELVNIWNDYLDNISDIAVELNLPGSSMTPFELLNQHASSPQHSEIITLMLPHVSDQTITNIAPTELANFLNSVRERSDLEQLKSILTILLTDANSPAMAWSMAHRTKDKVLPAVRQTGKITLEMLKNEVIKPDTNWKKVLFYVQVLVTDQITAKQVADIDSNTGNLDFIKLHLAIAKKPQTKESVSALKYYLSKLDPQYLTTIRSETDALVGGKNAFQIIANKPNRGDQFEVSALRIFIPVQAVVADPIEDQEP